VEQVAISSRDGQTPSDDNSAPDLLNALNLPAPTRGTVVLLVLMVFRALVPWVLVALVGWWVWKAVSK